MRAVTDVSFVVPEGRIVGFLGPNGAGKTTTMRILAGIFPPAEGHARIAGFDTRAHSLEARRRLGYFAESAPHYPELTVVSYLRTVARLKRLPRAAQTGAADDVIERLALRAVADRRIGHLSRGFRQRIGLAQAMLGDPPVLLLDEPTVGLDPEQAAELRARIAALRGTTTILLSSHNLTEVQALCDRVLVMRSGRLVADDAPQRLAARLRVPLRARLRVEAGPAEVLAVVGSVAGVRRAAGDASGVVTLEAESEEVLRAVSGAIRERGWLLLEMTREPAGLEDTFLSLVARPPGEAPS